MFLGRDTFRRSRRRCKSVGRAPPSRIRLFRQRHFRQRHFPRRHFRRPSCLLHIYPLFVDNAKVEVPVISSLARSSVTFPFIFGFSQIVAPMLLLLMREGLWFGRGRGRLDVLRLPRVALLQVVDFRRNRLEVFRRDSSQLLPGAFLQAILAVRHVRRLFQVVLMNRQENVRPLRDTPARDGEDVVTRCSRRRPELRCIVLSHN